MTYFTNVETAEEAKKLYRELAKKLHPDCGGTNEAFAEMSNEFEKIWARVKDIHTNKDGNTYTKESTENIKYFENAINSVLNCNGVDIEIIGTYIWLTGNTYENREAIKKAGYWYSKKNRAWYYNGDIKKSHKHSNMSMDDKRLTYGSTKVGRGFTYQLQA